MKVILRGDNIELIPETENEKEHVDEELKTVLRVFPGTKITTWLRGMEVNVEPVD